MHLTAFPIPCKVLDQDLPDLIPLWPLESPAHATGGVSLSFCPVDRSHGKLPNNLLVEHKKNR